MSSARPFSRRPAVLLAAAALLACSSGEPDRPAGPPGMVRVPAGPFRMGVDAASLVERFQPEDPLRRHPDLRGPDRSFRWWRALSETPEHDAATGEYFIDEKAVTNAQYARFVEATNRPPPRHWPDGRPSPEQAAKPVGWVSALDADAFAEWAGKSLPEEAEWEKAARGAYGMRDFLGTVHEWTATRPALYPGSAGEPREGLSAGRAARGSAPGGPEMFDRATARLLVEGTDYRPLATSLRWGTIGFRCAKHPAPGADLARNRARALGVAADVAAAFGVERTDYASPAEAGEGRVFVRSRAEAVAFAPAPAPAEPARLALVVWTPGVELLVESIAGGAPVRLPAAPDRATWLGVRGGRLVLFREDGHREAVLGVVAPAPQPEPVEGGGAEPAARLLPDRDVVRVALPVATAGGAAARIRFELRVAGDLSGEWRGTGESAD